MTAATISNNVYTISFYYRIDPKSDWEYFCEELTPELCERFEKEKPDWTTEPDIEREFIKSVFNWANLHYGFTVKKGVHFQLTLGQKAKTYEEKNHQEEIQKHQIPFYSNDWRKPHKRKNR